jgi:hypothetical protein
MSELCKAFFDRHGSKLKILTIKGSFESLTTLSLDFLDFRFDSASFRPSSSHFVSSRIIVVL